MTDRINLNEGGSLDEIVIGSAHLEQMDDNHWFLSMCREDGSEIAVWLWSDTPIKVSWERREPPESKGEEQ